MDLINSQTVGAGLVDQSTLGHRFDGKTRPLPHIERNRTYLRPVERHQVKAEDIKMVRAVPSSPGIETDTWVRATWQQYVALADQPAYESGRCYYDNGWMRIEMAALGPLHAHENSIFPT